MPRTGARGRAGGEPGGTVHRPRAHRVLRRGHPRRPRLPSRRADAAQGRSPGLAVARTARPRPGDPRGVLPRPHRRTGRPRRLARRRPGQRPLDQRRPPAAQGRQRHARHRLQPAAARAPGALPGPRAPRRHHLRPAGRAGPDRRRRPGHRGAGAGPRHRRGRRDDGRRPRRRRDRTGLPRPVWLRNLGFPPPSESEIEIGLGYTTWEFPRAAGDLGGDIAAIIGATVDNPRFGAALACEGDRWQVTAAATSACTPRPATSPGSARSPPGCPRPTSATWSRTASRSPPAGCTGSRAAGGGTTRSCAASPVASWSSATP